MDSLKKRNFAIDFGEMIGHGPVPAYVLGTRANLSDRVGIIYYIQGAETTL